MLHVLAVGALAASMLTGSALEVPTDAASPPSEKITIEVMTVNGSGCPAGTAAVAMSEDNTAFTVTYSDYLAMVGVGASPIDFRKNCQLSLRINVPSGFTYAVAQADYRGFAYLEAGATGLERASYYFQGSSLTTASSHWFPGPLVDNWQATDTADVAALVFSPCGESRNLNVNTELRVMAGTSDTSVTTSFMTMDSTDAAVSTVYHLDWQTCS
ncbi:MAG: DUF4360 domain-containing protein [Dactylosporangium sp.]|nr:DUF4360 domain-containing protein [Dactylosporangium sp.]NNJ60512.1 DUF4360 domain-containing protein [Dactylosporangium sp.]